MFIYKISNSINNKIYVGLTTIPIKDRLKQHIWKSFTKGSNRGRGMIHNAIRKHGKENFKIEEIGGANNLDELGYQEWISIHKFNCLVPNGYNIKEGGGAARHSKESKQKMSKVQKNRKHSEKELDRLAKVNIGRKHTPEAILNMKKGQLGKKATEETKAKISKSNKGKKLTQETKDKLSKLAKERKTNCNGRLVINIVSGEEWESCRKAANSFGINEGTLGDYLHGRVHNKTNLRWKDSPNTFKEKVKINKKVLNTSTGQVFNSISEAAKVNNINRITLNYKLLNPDKNNTNFKYLGEE